MFTGIKNSIKSKLLKSGIKAVGTEKYFMAKGKLLSKSDLIMEKYNPELKSARLDRDLELVTDLLNTKDK